MNSVKSERIFKEFFFQLIQFAVKQIFPAILHQNMNDSLIADKKRQLDILADYKKSLIYEYVTGKKEVPVNE